MISHPSRKISYSNKYLVYNNLFTINVSNIWVNQKLSKQINTIHVTVRNNRISDGCVYAQIRKGLGMHLVTYTNHDTVPFLLLVQYKGGLSEIEFIVSLFSNACMILLLFLKILKISCTSHYIKGGIAHSCLGTL